MDSPSYSVLAPSGFDSWLFPLSHSYIYASSGGRPICCDSCNACHSLKLVTQQGTSRERWDETLQWMMEEQGIAEIEDALMRDRILDYLSIRFGSG